MICFSFIGIFVKALSITMPKSVIIHGIFMFYTINKNFEKKIVTCCWSVHTLTRHVVVKQKSYDVVTNLYIAHFLRSLLLLIVSNILYTYYDDEHDNYLPSLSKSNIRICSCNSLLHSSSW